MKGEEEEEERVRETMGGRVKGVGSDGTAPPPPTLGVREEGEGKGPPKHGCAWWSCRDACGLEGPRGRLLEDV